MAISRCVGNSLSTPLGLQTAADIAKEALSKGLKVVERVRERGPFRRGT